MNGKDNLSNVAYKKANWVRYVLGGVLVVMLAAVGAIFFQVYENVKDIGTKYDNLTVVNNGGKVDTEESEDGNEDENENEKTDEEQGSENVKGVIRSETKKKISTD